MILKLMKIWVLYIIKNYIFKIGRYIYNLNPSNGLNFLTKCSGDHMHSQGASPEVRSDE